mmetsp:Transcript_63182/g.150664  ORF Transcript_63182/g.150664 Transcript_63182/m.150664 type:complete len:221 (+) Transcript_63182:64-726(+)
MIPASSSQTPLNMRRQLPSKSSRALLLLVAIVALAEAASQVRCAWVPMCGGRAPSTRQSQSPMGRRAAAEDASRTAKIIGSIEEALQSYTEQKRALKVDLPADAPFLGMWKVDSELPGFLFFVGLNQGGAVAMKAGFQSQLTRAQQLEWANTWNTQKAFTKALIAADGSLSVEYDLFFLDKSSEPTELISEAVRMFEASANGAAVELARIENALESQKAS